MSQCYVCLEMCDEKSPCICEMVVHKECLSDVCRKIRTKDCTVCKSPIQIEYIDLEIDPPSILEMHESVTTYENNYCACACINLCIFLIYLCAGWIGKTMLFLLGYKINILCFWCVDHLISSIGVVVIMVLITHLFSGPGPSDT
jgi:hypothetical protein